MANTILTLQMSNFDIAREALETSMNSEGSAMAEHEKYMECSNKMRSELTEV